MGDSEIGEKQPLLAAGKKVQDATSNGLEMDTDAIDKRPTVRSDVLDVFRLGTPIFITMLAWVGMKMTESGLLDHVSSQATNAVALSDIWTMCTAMLIAGRSLDILVGGAVGAGNPKLAGIYLQVSCYCLSWAALFVFVCWNLAAPLWLVLGANSELASMAGYYARILALSIPAQVLFGQLSQFFSAQKIMHPEMNASLVALALSLMLGFILVVGIGLPGFEGTGFAMCPVITTCAVYTQLAVITYVYVGRQRLHGPAWDGWAYHEITWPRIKTFCWLYCPTVLGMASDFWRVAVITAIASKFGEHETAVFNASYRVMWMALMVMVAISGACGINMCIRLGKLDSNGARQAGCVGVGMSAFVSIIMVVFEMLAPGSFWRLFTDDSNLHSILDEIKVPFGIALFLMNTSVALEKIPYCMGRTTTVLWISVVASWGIQIPAVYLLTDHWRNDLTGLFWGLAIGHGAMAILYVIVIQQSDWTKFARLTHLRSTEAAEDDKAVHTD